MGPPRGRRIGGLVEAVDDIDDEPQHQQRNADRHRQQNPVVEPEHVLGNLAVGREKADLAGFGTAENLRLRFRRDERNRERREARPDRV